MKQPRLRCDVIRSCGSGKLCAGAENLSRGASPAPKLGLPSDNLAVAGTLVDTYFNVDPARFATQNRHDID